MFKNVKTYQFKSSHVKFSQVKPRCTQPSGCVRYSTSEKFTVRDGMYIVTWDSSNDNSEVFSDPPYQQTFPPPPNDLSCFLFP